MNALRAELVKLAGLPSAWAGAAVALLVSPVVAFITASGTLDSLHDGSQTGPVGADTGFQELAFGVTGAIVLGVVAISSEYLADGEDSSGTRQITTSLTAVPSRARLLAAKTCSVVLVVACLSMLTCATTLGVTRAVLGDALGPLTTGTATRAAGVVIYWVLTALLAYAATLLTRNGIVPLAVLILNTSVVTVTYLLTKITPLADYLPDMAGGRMFLREVSTSSALAPLTGGLVMGAWVLALLACGSAAFLRRDA